MRIIREPINFYTHVIPAILAIPGTFMLLMRADTQAQQTAAWIYGICTFVLFGISSTYHGYPVTEKEIRFWQKFDHCCIYLMIAGSYTPTALLVFDGYIRWSLFAMIWTIAIAGCLLKIFNRLKNTVLSLAIYITMGALIIPLLSEMSEKLPSSAIAWMLLGGLFYVGGTFFYYKDKPMGKLLHSHEIWHLFVVAGALSHYVYNYFYLFA
ncbi:MAG: hemolysin III family protein [Daejeonella sp.]|uniref:PAQR family membrane homeostasis protein TrhA n=1 Tax=Daejeonella sp. TaxID=2805397 RepID=UPI003C751B3E